MGNGQAAAAPKLVSAKTPPIAAAHAALANVCLALFNLDEALTRE